MHNRDNHMVNREVFEFSCEQPGDAFALQHEMESGLQQKINRGITAVLDEIDDGNTKMRINKLELDLGRISFASMTDTLPGIFYNEFRKQLLNLVSGNKYTEPSFYTDEIKDNKALLEYFFTTGCLPWWAAVEKDFSVGEITSALIKNHPGGVRSLLTKHITNEKFRERLYFQLNTEVYEQLIELLFYSQVQQISFSQQILQLEDFVRTVLMQDTGYNSIEGIRKKVIYLISETVSAGLPAGIEIKLPVVLKEKIELVFKKPVHVETIDELIRQHDRTATRHLFAMTENVMEENNQEEALRLSSNTIDLEKEQKIYIQNSGLILAAVFLPAVFKELEWLDNGKFIEKEFQYRAIFLLHYLATGQTTAPEYTLHLNKILCGLDLEEPIPLSVELSEREKEEANNLLDSMIAHWAIIKNSSVEGLQGSFILRDGILSFISGHWLINVERKGYDILLDQVPWSWKTIKSDWMNTYIDVEW